MAETDSRVLEFLEEGLFLYGVGKVQEAIQRWRKVLELDPRNERALDYIESAGGDVSAFRKAAAAAPAPAPAQSATSFTPSFAPQAPAPMPTQVAPPRAAQPATVQPPRPAAPPPPANAPPPLPWQGQAATGGNPFAGFGPATVPASPAPARAPVPPPVEITALSPAPPGDTRDDLLRKAAALFRAQQHEMALELLERIAREFPPMDDTLRGYLDATRAAVLSSLRGQWAQMDRIPRQRMTPAQVMQLHMTPEAGFLLSRIDGMSTVEDILSIAGIEELAALRALSTLVQNGVIELA